MWDKTFIHLLWVPCSEKASPSSHSSKSAQLMKITLSGGWTASLWTHNGNKETARDRGRAILRETKETSVCACQCVCQSRAVWISYSAVTLAPAIVGDTSASSSQGSVPTCIKGLSKALLTLPGQPENQGLSIAPSDTMNTCSALITIPCFSEIVSAAIFSPNYFPLLWGLGSGLEPEEAVHSGQEGGGGVSWILPGRKSEYLSIIYLAEGNRYRGRPKLQPLAYEGVPCWSTEISNAKHFLWAGRPIGTKTFINPLSQREMSCSFRTKTQHIPETIKPYIPSYLFL